MQVKERMTAVVRTCRPEDHLGTAARIMWDNDCGCVPVVDVRGALVGIVTDRDACMAAYTRGLRLDQITVHSAMSHQVFTCSSTDSLETAEALLRKHQIRRLPVVQGANDELVGVLSLSDLLCCVAAERSSRPARSEHLVQTLAAVCAPRQTDIAPAAAIRAPGAVPAAVPAAVSIPTPEAKAPGKSAAPMGNTGKGKKGRKAKG